jgi:hypothetical protein
MTSSRFTDGGALTPWAEGGGGPWKRRAVLLGAALLGLLAFLLLLWNVFFHYVPPGHMLVIISKNGDPLEEGQVLARDGQKGIQEKVLGEGYHFVTPIVYSTKLEKNIEVQPGHVGVVMALGGKQPAAGGVLAETAEEKGIRRDVLLPGSYRLNPYGYKVTQAEMVVINPGFVGVKQRLLGKDGPTKFATEPTMKGIVRDEVLQPGIYPLNTEEYKIIPCEVGIYQTTYHYSKKKERNTALTFQARDGYEISLDCTIEWEIKPEFWPTWLAKFGKREVIARNVIEQHVNQICQARGAKFNAEDFLQGLAREKFQSDFRGELDKACKVDDVVVRSAFIRNIIIPEVFLDVKRKESMAVEQRLTSEALTQTAQTESEVAEAKQTIEQRKSEVEAETRRLVGVLDQETENVKTLTEEEIAKLKEEYGAKIAKKDAEARRLLGKAGADVLRMKDTATGSLYKMKMEVFGKDGEAFLRYTLAEKLSPELRLRLFQSGPGTLWTNMGDKGVNFMMPLPGGEKKPAEKKKEEPAGK